MNDARPKGPAFTPPKARPKLRPGQEVQVARYRHGWLNHATGQVVNGGDGIVTVRMTSGELAGQTIETHRRNVR